MKKVFRILLWVLLGAVLIGTFVFLFMNSRQKETVYETVTPERGQVERTTVLTGKIEPRDEIEIKPQISGIITEILVEPGDKVNNGDIIAKIKVIPDEGQLSQAQNRVQVARINLEQSKALYERTRMLFDKKYESREKLETDKAAYDQAVAELDVELRNLRSLEVNFGQGNASRTQLESQQYAVQNKQLAVKIADMNLFQAMETYDWAVNGLAGTS